MSGLRLISETIPKVTGKVFSRKYIMLGRLVTHWEDIVGKDLAHKTKPVKIRYIRSKKKGKKATASLDISATTADATVLHYRKDLMLERINQIFGDRWVTAIRFVPEAANKADKRVRPVKKALSSDDKDRLENALEQIPDPEMKEKLKKLGSAIIQDEQN